jgi:hypothetical protein
VSELGVSEFMNTPISTYAEVAPDLISGLEFDALDLARGGLETLIRVLCGRVLIHICGIIGGFNRHRDTEIQTHRHRDTETQRHRDTGDTHTDIPAMILAASTWCLGYT